MKNNIFFWFILFILGYVGFSIYHANALSDSVTNPEYQRYIADYRELAHDRVRQTITSNEVQADSGLEYRSATSQGTTSNFEGPQVLLKGIKFHEEFLTKEDRRLKHIDGVSAHFDPDHSHYGLPDVKISVQDVRLYEPKQGSLSKFLGFGAGQTPKPYKVYKKSLISDSLGMTNTYFEMQLWLTEFEVTIDIRPDRNIPISISNSEKENTTYPGYWYGSREKQRKLKDLKKEHQNQRYGNLSFILEVIPDHSPIYVRTGDISTAKADFAIGAVYCTEAMIGNEQNVQRISTNVHSGQPLFLNHEFDFDRMNENVGMLSENMELNADKILQAKMNDQEFIWNKPYYIKLFFNNLGSWRSGIFNQNQYHDQVRYRFLMPVFVVGSWDVVVPQEILPEWNPPEPYIRKIGFRNFLPFWKMGFIGKLASVIAIAVIVIMALTMIFPGVVRLIKRYFFNLFKRKRT
ncbi:MAG: hypothetical protein AAF934_06280 [Bacteroidota bacterium]